MKKIINPHMALLALGVLQPANAQEILGFLSTIFRDAGATPSVADFRKFLEEQCSLNRVMKVSDAGESYYSLTLLGSHYLPADIRKKRDKFRAYLLRDAHHARFIESRGTEDGLAGVSPASDTRSDVKGRAPNKLVRPAFGLRFALGRAYWPRIQGQFNLATGPTRSSRDTFPSLLSFTSKEQAQRAVQREEFFYDFVGLSICTGISAQMIWNITRSPSKFYRSFEIAKKAGGVRLIESPRVFLKVIQWFLADFVFCDLKVHDSVHSFSFKKSIATNAQKHERQAYVGSIDIEDFFGSITEERVARHLRNNGFSSDAAILAKLCTNRGSLPQGAPTSPIISNSILYEFDEKLSQHCTKNSLVYTRYADDITISGGSRDAIANAFFIAKFRLAFMGLRLNSKKSRIASLHGQQKVTGVVVNCEAAPPRAFRRTARAMFHQAETKADVAEGLIEKLGGTLGYLKIFPKLRQSPEVRRYERIIAALKRRQAGAFSSLQ